jgi:hypothetical protein
LEILKNKNRLKKDSLNQWWHLQRDNPELLLFQLLLIWSFAPSPMLFTFDVDEKHRKEKILTCKAKGSDGLIALYGIGYFGCPCSSNVVPF